MRRCILVILDGVGVRESANGNAFKLAKTPNIDYLMKEYPHSLLEASGEYVGLLKNQMGNSEVGHLTIGSGRVTLQPLLRINNAIKDGSFFENKNILEVINHVKENNSKLHIMGLLSDGGIHSHIDHIFALIKMAKEEGINKLYLHMFLDGRDTKKDVCLTYLDQLSAYIDQLNLGKIATISGRFYAMDREKIWDRTKKAYDVIVNNYGPFNESYSSVIEKSYEMLEYDEFIEPTIINKGGVVESKDGIIVANFRPDRLTQLFSAITNPSFDAFKTKKLDDIKVVTMTDVDSSIICTNAFSKVSLENTLGEVLQKNKYRVLRIAEISKFPHVTHFFDGDRDITLKKTKKICIPRKEVETYDLYPKMSARNVTDYIIKHLTKYDFIVVNYANGDMVGHTGNLKAAILAMEEVDSCLGDLFNKAKKCKYTMIITADHGNCEEMLDENDNVLTTHTTNPVNFIFCNKRCSMSNGSLEDIAPSILNYLDINIPKEMTGNIIVNDDMIGKL